MLRGFWVCEHEPAKIGCVYKMTKNNAEYVKYYKIWLFKLSARILLKDIGRFCGMSMKMPIRILIYYCICTTAHMKKCDIWSNGRNNRLQFG